MALTARHLETQMGLSGVLRNRRHVLATAVVLGAIVAAVDNFALGGEVSPITIVVLLSASAAFLGFTLPRLAWATAPLLAAWVPGAHLVKHLLGMPDTLHPNNYRSIATLAAFCLVVCVVTAYLGAVARWAARGKAADGASGA
jgi:hypothetical protein